MLSEKCLYLVPVPIGENSTTDRQIPELFSAINHYIVEEIRTARRFIRSIIPDKNINECTFLEFNEHNNNANLPDVEKLFVKNKSIVLMSEAGIPCVADPGFQVVRLAHKLGWKVIPLSGPSSIFMALMTSGLYGQRFMFHGYLPVKKEERIRSLRDIEQRIIRDNATQIFMEAPYRNNALFEDVLSFINPSFILSVSVNLNNPDEFIASKTIADWKKSKPDLHKKPAMFVLGKS